MCPVGSGYQSLSFICMNSRPNISASQLARVESLLGREPRGLLTIEIFDNDGEPAVLRVAPLVDNKPFPTLFWLVHPDICYWLDGLEAKGVISELQSEIDHSELIREAMDQYHRWYIKERWASADNELVEKIKNLGYESALNQKGVGGLGDYARVRCLHTWYGAHLVKANPVGDWLDKHSEYAFNGQSTLSPGG